MSRRAAHSAPVHIPSWGENGRFTIYCDQSHDEAKWGTDDEKKTTDPDVYVLDSGRLYTFEWKKVTCPDCCMKRTVETLEGDRAADVLFLRTSISYRLADLVSGVAELGLIHNEPSLKRAVKKVRGLYEALGFILKGMEQRVGHEEMTYELDPNLDLSQERYTGSMKTVAGTSEEEKHGFALALVGMKNGKKFSRRGWNGKDQWVALQTSIKEEMMTEPYFYIRTVDGKFVPWFPSQTDLMANDWFEVSKD